MMRMRRLICACIVLIGIRQVLSCRVNLFMRNRIMGNLRFAKSSDAC